MAAERPPPDRCGNANSAASAALPLWVEVMVQRLHRALVLMITLLAGFVSTSAWIGTPYLPIGGAAQAQSLPSCVAPPRCPPGETVECERGTCAMPHSRPVIGCVRATCVPVNRGAFPKLIMRQCAARPRCSGGRVAVCTTQGQCARTLRGHLVNGCLAYSCIARL